MYQRMISKRTSRDGTRQVIFGPVVKIYERIYQHGMCVLVCGAFAVVCLACAPIFRVIGPLSRMIGLQTQVVGIYASFLFSIVSTTGVRGAAACRLAASLLCAVISSGMFIDVVLVNDVGKCQSLVGFVDRYFLPFPRCN